MGAVPIRHCSAGVMRNCRRWPSGSAPSMRSERCSPRSLTDEDRLVRANCEAAVVHLADRHYDWSRRRPHFKRDIEKWSLRAHPLGC